MPPISCTLPLRWPYDLPTLQKLYPVPDLFERSTPQEGAMVQEASTKQLAAPGTCCHWNKLPTEIHVQILKLLMPEHGLRPIPQAAGDLDTSDSDVSDFDITDPRCADYVRKVREADAMPINLFLVSKRVSTLAFEIFHMKGPLQVIIEPDKIRFLNQVLDLTYQTPSHLALPLPSIFRRMHQYDLQFKFTKGGLGEAYNTWAYGNAREKFKERARMVADALSTNPNIKSLTVAVPCHCYPGLPKGFWSRLPNKETNLATLNFFEVLQRLRVNSPVKNVTSHGISTPESRVQCSQVECERLSRVIRSQMHPLQGAGLTARESEWKRIKLLPRSHIRDHGEMVNTNRNLRMLLQTLDHHQTEDFDLLSAHVQKMLKKGAPRTKSSSRHEKGSQVGHALRNI
ncbi:MAG: hypothetical protein Q9202_005705 [Teloschistes flavicans]